jgi:hypothetical protein
MVALAELLRFVGTGLGSIGGLLVFVEFFQTPSYVDYDPDLDSYSIDRMPPEFREHTWLGRLGGLAVAVGFLLLFVATFLG